MDYIEPEDVKSPKKWWYLFEVVLDRGRGNCAYALGEWNGRRRIGFRWNGDKENKLGNPQSRGLPTWTMLDEEMHKAVIDILPPEKQEIAKGFLGVASRNV